MPRPQRVGFNDEFGAPFRGDIDDESPFAEKDDRRLFVNKVFSTVAAMLVLPFGMCFVPFINDDVAEFYHENFWALFIPGILVYLICLIIVQCCEGPRRHYPCNVILLVLLSLSISLVTSSLASFYRVIVPAACIAIVLATVLIIGIVAKFAPCDVTGCGMLLMILGIFVLMFGICTIILTLILNVRILHTIYCGLGTLLAVLYIWYDLQLIMGGRRYELGTDEAIFGSVILFSDIILLFFYVIGFCGDMLD